MVEVDDRLVPRDGLANCDIAFSTMEAVQGGGAARFSFEIRNDDVPVGTLSVEVEPFEDGSIDHMMAAAHERVIDMLRQLLYRADVLRKHYARRANQAM